MTAGGWAAVRPSGWPSGRPSVWAAGLAGLAPWAAAEPSMASNPPPIARAAATETRSSGLHFMSPALQALQRDDAQNPALLWATDGAALWRDRGNPASRSCADCHGGDAQQIAGTAARHPAWDATAGQAVNLAGRINACRQRHQQAPPLAVESTDGLALALWLGLQSRGQAVAPPDDPRLAPLRAQGAALWQQRLGQLNLACSHCHDQRAGLQRRLRGCVTGVRAEPWPTGAPEWLALEAHLAVRAAGMPVATPAVRP